MATFIKGVGNISPQRTWPGDSFLDNLLFATGNTLTAVEPDYSKWINSPQLRRMSKVLKMGNAAAAMALKDSGITLPDAVITGTGYGCLEDTASFLGKITTLNETALNPTPFMQSTHNTIGSQIALLLQCQGYNQTYVHDAFSFEHSLIDAMMLLSENPGMKILAGGVEETTPESHAIMNRFGIYRQAYDTERFDLNGKPGDGSVHGEGATYFVLESELSGNSKAEIKGVETVYSAEPLVVSQRLKQFLERHRITGEGIDLVMIGKSGYRKNDLIAEQVSGSIFPQCPRGVFKHLSGEHCVAAAFALWLATKIILEQKVPAILHSSTPKSAIKNVLIYNPYFVEYHSFILLSKCQPIND